jgi:hypothetical protein
MTGRTGLQDSIISIEFLKESDESLEINDYSQSTTPTSFTTTRANNQSSSFDQTTTNSPLINEKRPFIYSNRYGSLQSPLARE